MMHTYFIYIINIYIVAVLLITKAFGCPSDGFIECATRGNHCSVSDHLLANGGTLDDSYLAAFGKDEWGWTFKTMTGSFRCNQNAFDDIDPAYRQAGKSCCSLVEI